MKILRSGQEFTGWAGDNRFFLVINPAGTVNQSIVIDLDEPGWMSEEPDLMRAPGEWLLVAKGEPNSLRGSVPCLAMIVLPGEQPYYTLRHMGLASGSGGEILIPGIGKKRADSHVDRLWLLPNGIVCSGDDVDIIGVNILKAMAAGAAE